MDRKYSSNGSEKNLIGVRDVSDSGQRLAKDGTERGNIGNPTGIVYGWERGQRLVRVGSQNGSGIYQRGLGGIGNESERDQKWTGEVWRGAGSLPGSDRGD